MRAACHQTKVTPKTKVTPREAEGGAELAAGAERAAVVAWLRAEAEAAAQTYTVQAGQWANRIDGLADDIERGEHRREEKED